MIKPIKAKSVTSRASSVPQWVKTDEIREKAASELQAKSEVQAAIPTPTEEYIAVYKCGGCHLQFTANELQTQIRKAARDKTSIIECPKCAASLQETTPIVLKKTATTKIQSTAKPPEVGNSARLYNTWIDKANYGHMIEALGRYLSGLGIIDPQLKFQRGIRSATFPGQNATARAAEFTVEYIDEANTRNRFVIQAGISPTGQLITPRTFRMLSGNEYPLTKEAIAKLAEGKMFEPAQPSMKIKPLVYRPVDPTQWRVISADKDGKMVKTANEELMRQQMQLYTAQGIDPTEAAVKAYQDIMSGNITQTSPSMTPVMSDPSNNPGAAPGAGGGGFMGGVSTNTYSSKTANDPLVDAINQGLSFEEAFADVQAKTGRMITSADWNQAIDMLSQQNPQNQVMQLMAATKQTFLETRKVTAADIDSQYKLPDLTQDERKIWVNAYVEAYNDAIMKEVGNITAIRTAQDYAGSAVRSHQVKIALRDEKTYAPVVDPSPDYSVAAQTDFSEKTFEGKYEDGDAGILPMEERNYNTMFRGGSLSLHKTAYITNENGKFQVHAESGRVLGEHGSRKDAEAQLQAIEINKHKKGSIEKEAESTGVDLSTEEVGQNPINYSRYKNIIQDLVRAGNIPPHSVDLHALKDGKYSLDELKKIVDTFKTDKSTFYPTSHAADEGMKKIGDTDLTAALQKELQGIQVPPNFPESLEEVQAASKTVTAAEPAETPVRPVDYSVLDATPRADVPAQTEPVYEAPPEVADLMGQMRKADSGIEHVELRIEKLKADFKDKLDPLNGEIAAFEMQQQNAANQIVAKLNDLQMRLVQAGNELGYVSQQPGASLRLSDASKVRLLLQEFGEKAQKILADAEAKQNEIFRVNSTLITKYKQWPVRRRGNDAAAYLQSLYRDIFNDVLQLEALTTSLESAVAGG